MRNDLMIDSIRAMKLIEVKIPKTQEFPSTKVEL